MTRPVVLDLFSGAGGASRGYADAGFDVVGCDRASQPNYPYEWHKGDVFQLFEYLVGQYQPSAIHASPSCRDHTFLTSRAGFDGTGFQLNAIRELLQATGLPYVIENVMGADMRPDLVLCGSMFGLRTYRHRQFEISGFTATAPAHSKHTVLTATKQRRQRWAEGWNVSITGDVGVYLGPEAMGIDWMNGNELCQAIPPAYTRHIGAQLLTHLEILVPA